MGTEVYYDDTAKADIKHIEEQLLQFQYGSPLYKKLVNVLEALQKLPSRAHMFPIDSQNPKYRKWSVGGYVILYVYQDNGSSQGPVAKVVRVIPSNWDRANETQHEMRRLITLCEAEQVVSDAFLTALRAWGDNTVFDRDAKHQALLSFEHEATRFRADHEWLYRGQIIDAEDFRTLRSGGSITIDLPELSSWSPDSDVAHTFARYAGQGDAQLVIMKRGLACFFDFAMLGTALERAGITVKEDEYDLHDPIREQEVIVRATAPLVISRRDVLEAFYFDTHGKQRHVGKLR